MTENRATEYLPRCFGVYSDISCGNCPYRRYEKEGPGCIYALHKDAIAMLKEQEPKEAKRGSVGGFACFVCGNCDVAITEGDRYCRHCGRKVLWK